MASRRTKDDIVRTEEISGHTIHFYRQRIETGEVLLVPTFIVRNSKLKGWQVRLNRKLIGYFSRFFADGTFGESASASLSAATRELKKLLREASPVKLSGLRVREARRKEMKLGIPGATFVWHLNKRRGIYELRINLRVGGGSRRAPRFMKSIYVGTEMSISEEKIREKLHKTAQLRRRWAGEHLRIYGEQLKRNTGRKENIRFDTNEIYQKLVESKERQHLVLESTVVRRVDDALRGADTLQAWRGVSLKRRNISVEGQSIKVPWFIDADDGYWYYTFPLPDGSVLGDAIPISNDMEWDLKKILMECMVESAMTTRPIPRDTVYPDSEQKVRFSKIPLDVIQTMNV